MSDADDRGTIRQMAARWRKALASDEEESEKRSSFSINVRLFLVCAGTLLLLLLVIFGANGASSAHLARVQAYTSNSSLLEDVSNQTLGFEKIFVISLPSRSDRRDAMSLAAAFSQLRIEYVDGVTHVDDKALPPGGVEKGLGTGALGAWRAHMNAIRTIVEQNLTSALIMEDDVDWDVRIKSQMRDFARGTRTLIQPIPGASDEFLDPTKGGDLSHGRKDFDVRRAATVDPTTSPYGDVDRWDVLWIGHCGTSFPEKDGKIPLGRAVIFDDRTVPEPQHIKMQISTNKLGSQYPPHTRVVHRTKNTMCTLAYAVSQQGARRLLYELGVKELSSSFDNALRSICNGKNDRELGTCYSVSPQLIQHHRPRGYRSKESDISGHGGFNEQAYSRNIRWSTHVNFPKLVSGDTDYIDSFKDGEDANPDLHWA